MEKLVVYVHYKTVHNIDCSGYIIRNNHIFFKCYNIKHLNRILVIYS